MRYETTMTVKGQITVPKDVRDALGLKPGQKVGIEVDVDGSARIVRAEPEAKMTSEAWLVRLEEARAEYAPLADFGGMDGLTYQRFIRPDPMEE